MKSTSPIRIIIFGLPGSGKTALIEALNKAIQESSTVGLETTFRKTDQFQLSKEIPAEPSEPPFGAYACEVWDLKDTSKPEIPTEPAKQRELWVCEDANGDNRTIHGAWQNFAEAYPSTRVQYRVVEVPPGWSDPRPPETKWRYFASHGNRDYRWRTDGHRVEVTHVEDEGWGPYKSYGPSYFLTPNSGPTYETDEYGQPLVETKPLPPGIPQPPEGFEYWRGDGYLDKPPGWTTDVALLLGTGLWREGAYADEPNSRQHYALRIGSEIHRLNTQPS